MSHSFSKKDTRITPSCAGFVLILVALGGTFGAHADETPLPITASSVYSDEFLPEYAADGNVQTRWASHGGGDGEWLQLDFGRDAKVRSLCIRWEAAYAADYEIQLSRNGSD